MRSTKEAGSGSTAATTSRGATSARPERERTQTGFTLSSPSAFNVLRTLINSEPSPYLKVTRLASIVLGSMFTSSCSTFTHLIGPMPSGNSNSSGSLNGRVVNQPRSFSQMSGGFRHSSITVQIENDGAKISSPSSFVTTRFPPSKIDMSSISLNRWSAA